MDIVTIDKDSIDDIEPLWKELNSHHRDRSNYFKDHFSTFTFSDRKKGLLAKENLAIFGAKDGENLVGYCIASCDKDSGEIESLFIKVDYQGASLGTRLMEAAMSWLSGFNCKNITVSVAEGNEDAIPFYERFGFKKRLHVLQLKKSH